MLGTKAQALFLSPYPTVPYQRHSQHRVGHSPAPGLSTNLISHQPYLIPPSSDSFHGSLRCSGIPEPASVYSLPRLLQSPLPPPPLAQTNMTQAQHLYQASTRHQGHPVLPTRLESYVIASTKKGKKRGGYLSLRWPCPVWPLLCLTSLETRAVLECVFFTLSVGPAWEAREHLGGSASS